MDDAVQAATLEVPGATLHYEVQGAGPRAHRQHLRAGRAPPGRHRAGPGPHPGRVRAAGHRGAPRPGTVARLLRGPARHLPHPGALPRPGSVRRSRRPGRRRAARSRSGSRDRGRVGLAALGGDLAGLHPLLLLALGAALWLAVTGGRQLAARFGAPAILVPLAGPPAAQAPAAAVGSVSLPSLFWTFLKLGSVVFGSGYVLLAFLRDDLVEGLRVISDRQLVDAVAVGQITPGPVFTTATFIGYLAAGTPGAVVAAVALMAGVAAQLAGTALVDPLTVALAAATLAVLLRWHPNPTWLIAAGATVGLLHGWA